MDWNFMVASPVQTSLIPGCILEAERANRVHGSLEGLRKAVNRSFHPPMIAVAGEILDAGRLLRDVADRSVVHSQRFPLVANYLNTVLPCLAKSLRDITVHYENKTLSREMRWRTMYHEMSKEAGGVTLPQRFMMYNHCMTMILFMLTRDPRFNVNQLEQLNKRILQLRQVRGIPAPVLMPSAATWPETSLTVTTHVQQKRHWAENVFAVTLPTTTKTPKPRPQPTLDSTMYIYGDKALPEVSKVLMQRSFDHDRLRLIMCVGADNDSTYFLFRMFEDHEPQPYFAARGVHEICVKRDGCALILKRWSKRLNGSKMWARLSFSTWEELILFQCTFAALKARDYMTTQVNPENYKSSAEKRLFQAQILDDGFTHCLIVYEDMLTKGLRLHATVWEGELRECPVWTAFITQQSRAPSWLSIRDKQHVMLKDVHIYVFCNDYRSEHMRDKETGSFELYFPKEEAARHFRELFLTRLGGGDSVTTDATDGG